MSDDPSLSAGANQMLTDELREIVGRDEVEVPSGAPHHERDAHGGHTSFVASLIETRLGLIVTGLVLLVTVAVAALATKSVLVLIVALLLLLAGTGLVAFVMTRRTGESEHVSPSLAAKLEDEGVGDPDRMVSELAEEY